jgi:hypothetical protein
MSETTAPRPVSFASLVQQFFTEYLYSARSLLRVLKMLKALNYKGFLRFHFPHP